MRSGTVLLIALSLAMPVSAAQSGILRIQPHAPVEIDLPVEADPAWNSLGDRAHCSFAPTDTTFERHRVPNVTEERHSWSGIAWRGERVHAQVLVWSKKPLEQLRAAPAPLSDPDGRTIPASAMRIRFVRYVLSELPAGSGQSGRFLEVTRDRST